MLDASSFSGGSGRGTANLLFKNLSPLLKQGITGILRNLKIENRTKELMADANFTDLATKKPLRQSEASAGAWFEDIFKTTLKPATKAGIGDFIATSGKFANKTIEHIGGFLPGKNNMSEWLPNLEKHLSKGDVLLMDLRKFSKEEKTMIYEFMKQSEAFKNTTKSIIKME